MNDSRPQPVEAELCGGSAAMSQTMLLEPKWQDELRELCVLLEVAAGRLDQMWRSSQTLLGSALSADLAEARHAVQVSLLKLREQG